MIGDVRIGCSETALALPLLEAWRLAERSGIDALEVYGPLEELCDRFPDLRAARRRGVVISTLCLGPPFLGRLASSEFGSALRSLKQVISISAELETSGVVLPIAAPQSFGAPPRGLRPDVVDALAELAAHAESEGTVVFVEPLNRYEDGEVNRLAQVVHLCIEVGSSALAICADLFHMNIEEASPPEAIRATGPWLGHVHVADSNRRQPGSGHMQYAPLLGALHMTGYRGWLALECAFDDTVDDALRTAVAILRDTWREQAATVARLPGSPGWQDDAPSSSSATPGTTFATPTGR